MGIGRFAYTPILPAMVAGLGLTKAQAGLLASANLVGYLAGALGASLPGLPGSRRTWLLGSLAASTVSTVLMAAAHGLTAFLALRFLGGLTSAFVLVFASTVILDRLAALGRTDLSALHFAGIGTGIALSAVLVSALAAAGVEWRGLWLGVGLVALAGLAAVAALVPPERTAGPVRAAASGRLALDRPLAALMGAYFLFGLGYVTTATFLVAIVRSLPSLSAAEPVIWVVVGCAAAPSVALWNGVGRRVGIVPAFALALLVEAAGVAGSVLAGSAAGALVAAAMLGGTFVAITALGILVARSLARDDARRVVALVTAAFSLGSIIAPSVAGLIADRTGSFSLPSFLAAGALVLAAVLALAARRA